MPTEPDFQYLLDSASPAPWVVDGDTIKDALGHVVALWHLPGRDPQPWHRVDAELIARARQDIVDLLAERERLREVLDLWRDYYHATTPVTQAGALIAFSNALYHLGADLIGDISWLSDPYEDAPEQDNASDVVHPHDE